MTKKSNPVNNKEEFEKWLSTRTSKAGKPYSPGTPKNYINGLIGSYPAFKKEYGLHKGVFAVNDPTEFARIVAAIKAKKSYSEFRKRGRGLWFAAAATQYKAFLEGEGSTPVDYKGSRCNRAECCEKHPKPSSTIGDNKKEFEEWLRSKINTRTGKPYSSGTPKNYINGLNGSYSAFKGEYGQYNGAFVISDPIEFATIVGAIRAKKSYGDFRKRASGLWFAAAAKEYLAFLIEKRAR